MSSPTIRAALKKKLIAVLVLQALALSKATFALFKINSALGECTTFRMMPGSEKNETCRYYREGRNSIIWKEAISRDHWSNYFIAVCILQYDI